jgi:cysteine desulfurase
MTKKYPIYLDYAATTPVDPRVAQKMGDCLTSEGSFGNPASLHPFGVEALEKVENARKYIARLVHVAARQIIFTSGATEANNLAIKGVADFYQEKGKHIITLQTEHPAVLDTCAYLERKGFSVTYLKPKKNGLLDFDIFNETGVIQDIRSIGEITHGRGIFFHVDAAQSVGKIPIDLQNLKVDLMSLSAHKLYGPKGVGALYINDTPRVRLIPQLHGGGQERKMRAGTLATHQIIGMGEACRILLEEHEADMIKIKKLRDLFLEGIKNLPATFLNVELDTTLPSILNVRFESMEKQAVIAAFKHLAFSSASACNSTSIEPSHVLRAMGYNDKEADHSFRFSFGRFTTIEEIHEAVAIIQEKYLKSL